MFQLINAKGIHEAGKREKVFYKRLPYLNETPCEELLNSKQEWRPDGGQRDSSVYLVEGHSSQRGWQVERPWGRGMLSKIEVNDWIHEMKQK